MAKKNKRKRHCKHEKLRIHSVMQTMHKCRECDLREMTQACWREEGKPNGVPYNTYCRQEWGRVPGPCNWPKFCGRTIPVEGMLYAKCPACGATGGHAATPFGALRAFAWMVRNHV